MLIEQRFYIDGVLRSVAYGEDNDKVSFDLAEGTTYIKPFKVGKGYVVFTPYVIDAVTVVQKDSIIKVVRKKVARMEEDFDKLFGEEDET